MAKIVNYGDIKLFLLFRNDKSEDVVEELSKVAQYIDEGYYGICKLEKAYIDDIILRLDGMVVNKQFPVTMDRECLVKKIKSKFQTSVKGRSGFARRNNLIIEKEIEAKKVKVVDLKINFEFELDEIRRAHGAINYYILETNEKEIEDWEEVNKTILDLKRECKEEYEEAVVAKYGDVINGVEFGPYEEFDHVPSSYYNVFRIRTRCTEDYRRGFSHTYRVWAVRKGFKGVVILNNIPDEEKGKIIGKGGSKIKEKCKEIGCKKIILK